MRNIEALDDLDIPDDYRECISEYINNLSSFPFISRVILFGSCARESVERLSDIDIFVTANRDITEDEEISITAYCYPEYAVGKIPMDIIVQPENIFIKYINKLGMVQQQVNKYGVDLSGLLHQRSKQRAGSNYSFQG